MGVEGRKRGLWMDEWFLETPYHSGYLLVEGITSMMTWLTPFELDVWNGCGV